ncbi:alpha/beta fold hydrolase [Niabella drilacis]|uniref:Pimeloyl-ACP methyl ester carboxylesterase n=1 Tax=Niabella drilacis (strain DSM 25811 / CCM 8410 / CCUG 62505 / LMG 26954 / E90) TaxID=1285928 RepID=A0A1G6X1Y3_NIADE|nr:alpha/beta hydrolase [Niabella drilacis]SDD72111.1 Pimeloyl-ACP methyl ester carboxylesterase [Niabella drilacis]
MKPFLATLLLLLSVTAWGQKKTHVPHSLPDIKKTHMPLQTGYSLVNGIKMYYEIYGKGAPLVLIHGGGSTIQTSFGRIIPLLAQHRQLICVELQAHGRTGDRNTPLSFEQDADDVAALLRNLGLPKADIFGFSNGGNTALQIAIRHPRLCNRIIAGSVLLKHNGTLPQFWEFMKNGTFDQMPQAYKDAFLTLTPDPSKLHTLFQKCKDRVLHLTDISDEALRFIQAPVLLVNGDADVATPEHVIAISRLIPHCNLAILPGGHGEYMGEITAPRQGQTPYRSFVLLMERFLDTERQ